MSKITQFVSNSGSGGFVQTLTGNSGGAVPPTGGNINVVGSGSISVTGNPGTSTLTISSSGGGGGLLPWTVVTTATQTLASNNGYIADNNDGSQLVTFTLPATAAVGDVIWIVASSDPTVDGNQFVINQNAGQIIGFVNNTYTTTGTGGSVTSVEQFCSLQLLCTVANTNFTAITMLGNFTLV